MFTIYTRYSSGSDIRDCFDDARAKAKAWGAAVEFDFNGVICIAEADGDTDVGVRNYMDCRKEYHPTIFNK